MVNSMSELLLSFLNRPQSRQLIIFIGLILVLPGIASGFFADDFGHYVLINEPELIPQSRQGSLFHLFSFIDNDVDRRAVQYSQSLIPWWTSESITINFWRPVSELTHYVDHVIMNGVPWMMHLQSLVFYGLLLWLLSCFYQKVLVDRNFAALALLFFAVDSTHGLTVAWIANRNALLAALFAMLVLAAHHQYRTQQNRIMLLASCFFLALGLLSAEIAVSVGAFLMAYALFLDKSGAIKGLLYLLPALIVVVVWQILYQYLGYGIAGNEVFYIDPLGQPLMFIGAALLRYPEVISAQFNILPFHLVEILHIPVLVSGIFILLLLVYLGFRKKDAVYNFFLFAMCLSVFPVVTTMVQDRNMLFVGIAGAGIFAKLVFWLIELSSESAYKKIATVMLAVIIFCHIFLSAILMLPMSLAPRLIAKTSIDAALSIPENIESQKIVSFGVPLFDVSYISAIRKSYHLPIPEKFWNVTTFKQGVTVKRISSTSILVTHPDGLLKQEDFYLRDFSSEPMVVNQVFKFNDLTIRIVEVNDDGVPRQLELLFDDSLDYGKIQLMYWQDGVMQPFVLASNESRGFPLSLHDNLFERITGEK